MSLIIPVYNVCEKCGHKSSVVVHGVLNCLLPEDMEQVFTDKLNMVECPQCGHTARAKFAVLYDNVVTKSCVWYSPCKGKDEFFDGLSAFFNLNDDADIYQKRPIIVHSWESFKEKIADIESKSKKPQLDKPTVDKCRHMQAKVDSLVFQFLEFSYEQPTYVLQDGSCLPAKNIVPGLLIIIGIIAFFIFITVMAFSN